MNICLFCGEVLEPSKYRPRKYCSDSCKMKDWYQNNREKRLEYAKKWNKKNRELHIDEWYLGQIPKWDAENYTKICPDCKQKKSWRMFRMDRQTVDGLTSYCKFCKTEEKKCYLESNIDRAAFFKTECVMKHRFGLTKPQGTPMRVLIEISEGRKNNA